MDAGSKALYARGLVSVLLYSIYTNLNTIQVQTSELDNSPRLWTEVRWCGPKSELGMVPEVSRPKSSEVPEVRLGEIGKSRGTSGIRIGSDSGLTIVS